MSAGPKRQRVRVRCIGAVQGVGFRPTVHRLATGLGLAGWVANGPGGATVAVEGPAAEVDQFVAELPSSLPPLARLAEVELAEEAPTGERGFTVLPSDVGARSGALVPADAALCPACRQEMDDSSDRRHRYPFTTCTDCGPRYSLVTELPYDRQRTSMACFPLCPACRAEYDDPGNRRFHAEPLCCPECGPRLWLADVAHGTTRQLTFTDAAAGGLAWRPSTAPSWRSRGWAGSSSRAAPTTTPWSAGCAIASGGPPSLLRSWSGTSSRPGAWSP